VRNGTDGTFLGGLLGDVVARLAALGKGRRSGALGTIGHDLRTPIGSVLGWSELLLETPLTAEQRGYAEDVHRAGERMLEIVNDVVELARLEAGEASRVRERFAPATIVEEATERAATAAHTKGLEIAHHVDRAMPASVAGDARRLGRVLGILLDNAVRVTEEGEIVVRARVGAVRRRTTELVFEIADTGRGIPTAEQHDVFAPASGLGLALARALVVRMGGRIGVRSEVGSGSTFWFTVRVHGAAGAPVATPLAGRPRVLVVDDRLSSRAIVEDHLRTLGARSNGAADPRTALARLATGIEQGDPYAAVVIDVDMPGTDGHALVRAIGTDARLASLPIVLLVPPGDRARGSDGAVATVPKPVRPALLRDAVALALSAGSSGRRSLRAAGS